MRPTALSSVFRYASQGRQGVCLSHSSTGSLVTVMGNSRASAWNQENSRYYHKSNTGNGHNHDYKWQRIGGSCGALTVVGFLVWKHASQEVVISDCNVSGGEKSRSVIESGNHEHALKHLPVYTRDDVAGIMTFPKRGVYDVTDFVAIHPGGSRILMAAGGSLEPFWELYPVHQKSEVFGILEKYRIGNLREEDVLDTTESVDHFKGEPSRHPALIRRAEKPSNAETPPSLLTEKFYTPNEVFYVRNHLPVPSVDAKSYQLEVEGINIKDMTFTLNDAHAKC